MNTKIEVPAYGDLMKQRLKRILFCALTLPILMYLTYQIQEGNGKEIIFKIIVERLQS